MKILVLHNYYRQRGGEDEVVDREVALLRAHGHEVRLEAAFSKDIRGLLATIGVAIHLTFSRRAYAETRRQIETWRPDVVHVHNTFPLLTPAVHYAAYHAGIPAVQTLHNYRLFCPSALLWRDDGSLEACQKSVSGCIRAGCYRGSRIGTLTAAHMIRWHRRHGTWRRCVDAYIAPTDFVRRRHIEAGLPADRVVVRPHFVPSEGHDSQPQIRDGAVFVGRLSAEKGLHTLLAAWHEIPDFALTIVGDGPLSEDLRRHAPRNVELCGRLSRDAVQQRLRRAAVLVLPSSCYEVMPLVIPEAYQAHLPVIASRIGGLPELVREARTGLLFTPGDPVDLAAKVHWIIANPAQLRAMGTEARAEYERRYTPEVGYQSLLTIYDRVVSRPRGNQSVEPEAG